MRSFTYLQTNNAPFEISFGFALSTIWEKSKILFHSIRDGKRRRVTTIYGSMNAAMCSFFLVWYKIQANRNRVYDNW